ncbi:hypothetical protein Bbelb_105730 [Branchiostoma belcheri]|nr:hypothetical protein Bbelb_105730 [Branchiostoma belcheri]
MSGLEPGTSWFRVEKYAATPRNPTIDACCYSDVLSNGFSVDSPSSLIARRLTENGAITEPLASHETGLYCGVLDCHVLGDLENIKSGAGDTGEAFKSRQIH